MASGDEYAESLAREISAMQTPCEHPVRLASTGNVSIGVDSVLGIERMPLLNAATDERRTYCCDGMTVVFSNAQCSFERKDYIDRLSVLPEPIARTLSERGWKIVMTNKDITDLFPIEDMPADVDDPIGICWIPEKKIYINEQATPSTIIHEIAHAIDWESGGASIRPEWTEALEADTQAEQARPDTLFTKRHGGNITKKIYSRGWFFEYWAEAFETYWNNPEALLQQYPRCYEYFEDRYGKVLTDEEKEQAKRKGEEIAVDDIMMPATEEEKTTRRMAREHADSILGVKRILESIGT